MLDMIWSEEEKEFGDDIIIMRALLFEAVENVAMVGGEKR